MNTILSRLTEIFPWVTRRSATEADFYDHCDAAGIRVHWTLTQRNGVYVYLPLDGSDHIFLNPTLYGFRLLHVMFHELGHAIFHVPSQSSDLQGFDRDLCRRNHAEAEAVAAYLLITPADLELSIAERRHALPGRTGQLISLRYRLWQRDNDYV